LRGRALLLAGFAAAALGCAGSDKVVRVIDGRPVVGEFVPAEAYAAYLRGAIADAAGDLGGAIEGYAIACALGPRDPEPLARLGDARCRRDPRDPRAEEAIAGALAIDGAYAPALEARAQCAERRGDDAVALASVNLAARANPAAVEPLATLARMERGGSNAGSAELRERLVAMTLLSGTDASAWDALASWARGHGDAQLEARALAEVVRLESSRRGEVADAALRFEGEGEITAARSLARARVEVGGTGAIGARIARLAIDDALLAGDIPAASRMATRSHVGPIVVAARALLAGDYATARSIAATLLNAEPRSIAPRLVIAAASDGTEQGSIAARILSSGTHADAPVPPEAWLTYVQAVAHAGGPEGARAVLQAILRDPLVGGDSVTTPIAVALAASGALDASELDPNGRVELAERRAEPAPDDALVGADARHRLLALARRAPRDPKTIALASALSHERVRDPVVAVAFARLALSGAIDVPSMSDVLARLDPTNPLVAAAALDCALRAGDVRAIPLARSRLAAVAHTPAERARVIE
jgi:hypothetical protein